MESNILLQYEKLQLLEKMEFYSWWYFYSFVPPLIFVDSLISLLLALLVPFILPLAIMCSVKPDGIPQLCRTDEIGELCVCAVATGTSYYGLSGMTKNTFEVG